MRAKHAREIRDGINRARTEVAKGIPPRPDVNLLHAPEPLGEQAYRRTVNRFHPPKPEPHLILPPVPGPDLSLRRVRRWWRR